MKSTLLKTHFMLNSNLLLYIFYCSNDINELVLLLLYTIHSARLFGSKTILLHVQNVVKLALGKIITSVFCCGESCIRIRFPSVDDFFGMIFVQLFSRCSFRIRNKIDNLFSRPFFIPENTF